MDTVSAALARNGQTAKPVTRWFNEMPREEEMLPKDKYTIFDKKEKKYRKGIHSECSSSRPRSKLASVDPRAFRQGRKRKLTLQIPIQTELPKWTRVSQRVNPPGF